jgi:hypothetical protein
MCQTCVIYNGHAETLCSYKEHAEASCLLQTITHQSLLMIYDHMSDLSLSPSITMSVEIFNSLDGFFFYLCLIPVVIIFFGIYRIHDYMTNRLLIQAAPDSTYRVSE